MSDQINEPAVEEDNVLSEAANVDDYNEEEQVDMSVNAAALAAVEPEAEPAPQPEPIVDSGDAAADSATDALSVNAAALGTERDETTDSQTDAGPVMVNEPDDEEEVATTEESIGERVRDVVDGIKEVAEIGKQAVQSAADALGERETLAEARQEATADSDVEVPVADEAVAYLPDEIEEGREALQTAVDEAGEQEEATETATTAASEAVAYLPDETGEARETLQTAVDEADEQEEAAEDETEVGEYLPEGVAAEVPSETSEVVGQATDVVGMDEVEETGEAAAITTPKSVDEADAAIEAAGAAPAVEGSAPTSIDVTDEGVPEDVAATSEPEKSEAVGIDDEGQAEPEVTKAEPEAARAQKQGKRKRGKGERRERRKFEDIQPGEEIQGLVRSVQAYGAFVDVGAERDGLIHISELREGFVEKVEDVVEEGDMVTVRVKDVDTERGRLSLTMRSEQAIQEEQEQKQRLRLRDLSEGQEFLGTVTSIVDFGAFIDIGARTDGLVHISELSDERVNRVGDVVSEGEEVKVRVLNVDRKRNRISLTMREQVEEEEYTYEEEGDEEPPSLMELAFQRARERSKKERRASKKSNETSPQSDVLEDIIERTLREHGES